MICGFVWTKSGESQTQTWSDTLRPESGDTVCREADEWWRHVECSHNTTTLATITVVNSSALVQAHAHAVPAQCWDHGFWEVSKCFYFRAVQRGFSKTKLTFNLISWLGLPGLRNLFFFSAKTRKIAHFVHQLLTLLLRSCGTIQALVSIKKAMWASTLRNWARTVLDEDMTRVYNITLLTTGTIQYHRRLYLPRK